MVFAFNPMSCPHLAVSAGVMEHVIQAESGGNRFAIGIVGSRLERQPRNLGEAIATARMLETKGYDFSLGIAQINRSNLPRYGLSTYEQAFDACANLTAGARILAECYGRSGDDWGKAFSCYYSGNFTTGYRDGYVQRIIASFDVDPLRTSEPITVRPQTTEHPAGEWAPAARPARAGSSAYRVPIRSVAMDAAGHALVAAVSKPGPAKPPDRQPLPAPQEPTETTASAFVPRVSGPGGAPSSEPTPATSATGSQTAPNQETADAAFVF
ncbi:transglycosylase SLT domain-containing protein [Frateuria sp. GZRe12]|uniref:lytic transglycosylase domain-containing protein n=1 Tax=Frateuria sp. GZRe12 TaxID=3351533 RepID=UPI003EDC0826